MKRIILLFPALLIVASLTLSGCGKEDNKVVESQEMSEEELAAQANQLGNDLKESMGRTPGKGK